MQNAPNPPPRHRLGNIRGSVEWRLATGTLHRRHREVYLVGHGIPVPGAVELAAVLACGERALVSHRSAAALWRLASPPVGEVDLTVVARGCRSREGMRVHRVQNLAAADRAETRGPSRTRSGGERALLRLLRAARLPTPRTNAAIAGFTADFCWPDQRLIVELDGYPFHGHRAALERDHRRDIAHRDAGYEVLRFTWRQFEEAPVYVVTAIARALDRRSRTRG